MINELAHGGKPTRRNILHCEATYQWGYFLYYMFRYFSNFYKLQLDKSNKGRYKSLLPDWESLSYWQ